MVFTARANSFCITDAIVGVATAVFSTASGNSNEVRASRPIAALETKKLKDSGYIQNLLLYKHYIRIRPKFSMLYV